MGGKILLIFIIAFLNLKAHCQLLFYQDLCNCGVTGAGFSTSLGTGSGSFNIYIEPGSTVRKAFFFIVKFGASENVKIPLNNLLIDPNNSISSFTAFGSMDAREIEINAIDVTNLISTNQLIYEVTIPEIINNCSGCSYNSTYLYVLYENPMFEKVTSYIYINNIDEKFIVDYKGKPFNSILENTPIGFAVYTDRIGISPDGSYLFFKEDTSWHNAGMLSGEDNVNIEWGGGGVKGHFFYQNNVLFGLDDDTADYIVANSDGLVDISPFVNFADSLEWRLQWETNSSNGRYNIYNGFFITHSTPCQPFDVTVPNDTTVCYGSQVQLNATGGSSTGSLPAYEWSPATGLSCTTCPNPIFTADSSMFYTVRIRNNDSCSVVRPVKINVRQKPAAPSVTTQLATCGAADGSLTAVGIAMQDLFVVTENGDTLSATSQNQLNATVSNLGAGNYAVFYTDTNGCVSLDTVVTVNSINNTVASFSVSPSSGGAPLTVNINNTSQYATDFEWSTSTGSVYQGPTPPAYVFDSSGTYQIMLVAWQHDPACADTAYASVWVYDSLIVHIPNVFSPNSDGINDFFSITVNQTVKAQLQILNRWGNEVFSFDGILNVGVNDLWNGADVTSGVYFYVLTIDSVPTDLNPPPVSSSEGGVGSHSLKKEGFITVIGG